MEQFTIIPLFVIPILFIIIISLNSMIKNIIPTNWQIVNESIYRSILILIQSTTGTAPYYFPILFTLFYMIFISNYVGLIPYSTTASTEIVITLMLAFILLIGLLVYGILIHGPTKIIDLFLPAGTPIFLLPLMIPLELLAYVTRTFSLGLRLAVNLITGHILVKVLLSFIPSVLGNVLLLSSIIIFLIIFLALEILISYLQAYIFVFITIITLRDIQ
jgi:ATP synthase subunit 6